MSNYNYLLAKIESSRVHQFHKFITENNGEIIKMLSNRRIAEKFCKTLIDKPNLHNFDRDAVLKLVSDEEENLEGIVLEEIKKYCNNEHYLFHKKHEDDLNRLLTSISHHWRQPLNVLALSVQEICELYHDKTLSSRNIDEFQQNALDTIQNMSLIIDSFKASYKTTEPHIKKNLVHHIFDLLKLYMPELTSGNIALRFRCSCYNSSIDCDSFNTYPPCDNEFIYDHLDVIKFNLAFVNIFENAKDAVYDALKQEKIPEGLIQISLVVSRKFMTISIKNNGDYISDKIKDRIFLPYFTTKDENHGTGLGLFIAKTAVTNFFNGGLEFHNCPDGVEFIMTIKEK